MKSLREDTFFQRPMRGFTLARAIDKNVVFFKKSTWPGVILRARGLSFAEAWGTWSSDHAVTLEFSMPPPEKFTVHLVVNAFGPNIGKEFVAHVGDSAIGFTLGHRLKRRCFNLITQKDLTS